MSPASVGTASANARSTGKPISMSTVSEGIRVCREKAGPTGWTPWALRTGNSAEKVESNAEAMSAIGKSAKALTTVGASGASRKVTSV